MPAPTREQILADPNVQAILRDPRYTSPMLRDGAVNNYLQNDPRSPFRAAMSDMRSDGTTQNAYHYNTQTGQMDKTNTYGHPGTMRAVGLGSVAAGGALAAAGLLPGMAGGGAAAGGGAGAATAVPSMPWTIPTSMAYETGMFGVPGGTAAGVAAGHAGLGTIGAASGAAGAAGGAAGGAGGAGAAGAGGLLSQLTSGQGLAGLAGLLTTLAMRPNSGSGGSGNGLADNAQLQRLLDMSAQRAERTDPLHQAVTQLAMSRMPTNMQR